MLQGCRSAHAAPLTLHPAPSGPYLVFLCSTVNGYEGTGRSLSLKLIQQLRQQVGPTAPGALQHKQCSAHTNSCLARDRSAQAAAQQAPAPPCTSCPGGTPLKALTSRRRRLHCQGAKLASSDKGAADGGGARTFREVILSDPIRRVRAAGRSLKLCTSSWCPRIP